MKKQIVSILLVLALCLTLLPQLALRSDAQTRSGVCGANGDNLTWTLDAETGVLTIEGSGRMKNYSYNSPAPWDADTVKRVVLPGGLTSVGDMAFLFCSSLTEIPIPESVTYIGREAFRSCGALVRLELPAGLTDIGQAAFSGCFRLKELTIPEGVTRIGAETFRGCGALEHVTLPDGVMSIGQEAFCQCGSLTELTVPISLTYVGYSAFYECNALTKVCISDLTAWLSVSFGNYYSNPLVYAQSLYLNGAPVTELVIPDDVTHIGAFAFACCGSLTKLTIPAGVTEIGDYAFDACAGLTELTLPNGVTEISSSAFRNCSGLTSVTLPDSVTRIGDDAFSGCAAYREDEANWSDGILYAGNWAIAAKPGLKTAEIKDETVGIAGNAFCSATELTDVTIPESVTCIGELAFSGCVGLTSVTLPESVTYIGRSAFFGCEALHDFTLPQKLEFVGAQAFGGTAFSRDAASWKDGSLCKDNVLLFYNLEESDYGIPDGTYLVADEVFDYDEIGYYQDSYAAQENAQGGCGADAVSEPAQRSAWIEYPDVMPPQIRWPNENVTVYVPASVRQISGSLRNSSCMAVAVLQRFPYQPRVQVDPQNAWYRSDAEGALFSKDGTKLISCPSVRTGVYTVPEHVKTVGEYAFARSELGTVVLPNNVELVEGAAFRGSTAAVFVLSRDCKFVPRGEIDWGMGTWWDVPDETTFDTTLGEGLAYGYGASAPESYALERGYRFHVLPDTFQKDDVFRDVNGSSYYMEPVMWAGRQGVTNGTGEGLFSPQRDCIRAQVVTFLWRANGCPEPVNNTNPFVDVPAEAYYAKAVCWAVEKGITNGIDATHFGAQKTCTRAQVVTFLWRATGCQQPVSDNNPFTDVPGDAWFCTAVLWAVENGITNGVSDTRFAPEKPCARAQVVTFLYRALAQD